MHLVSDILKGNCTESKNSDRCEWGVSSIRSPVFSSSSTTKASIVVRICSAVRPSAGIMRMRCGLGAGWVPGIMIRGRQKSAHKDSASARGVRLRELKKPADFFIDYSSFEYPRIRNCRGNPAGFDQSIHRAVQGRQIYLLRRRDEKQIPVGPPIGLCIRRNLLFSVWRGVFPLRY